LIRKKPHKKQPPPKLHRLGSGTKYFTYAMNNTRKIPQKSRVSPKNPYSTTGLSGNDVTSPNKPLLSRIKANFGRNCQNKLNFAARVSFLTAQKINFLGGVG